MMIQTSGLNNNGKLDQRKYRKKSEKGVKNEF